MNFSKIETSSAEYTELTKSLDQIVMPNPMSTYIGYASGESMKGIGIHDGDLLIVDRSLQPEQGDVIVATLNGEFICKVIDIKNRTLISASGQYPAVKILPNDSFTLEGVVSSNIRMLRPIKIK